jgi:hypothetical protein
VPGLSTAHFHPIDPVIGPHHHLVPTITWGPARDSRTDISEVQGSHAGNSRNSWDHHVRVTKTFLEAKTPKSTPA